MTITFEHLGGVGMRGRYLVRKEGEGVAIIERYSHRTGWEIKTIEYHETLGWGETIDAAKVKALTIAYPSAQEQYDAICARVEKARRIRAESFHAHRMAELARAIVAGSNSAREEIEQLLGLIEAFATDRLDQHTHSSRYGEGELNYPRLPGEDHDQWRARIGWPPGDPAYIRQQGAAS